MKPDFILGIHSPLEAKLLQSLGHTSAWIGGYARAIADYAIPDLDILSYTENLEAQLRIMGAAPLRYVVDVDAGIPNERAQARYLERLGQANPFAVCIEDEPLPKTSALYPSSRKLLQVEAFSARLASVRANTAARVWARTNAIVRGVKGSALDARIEALVSNAAIDDLVLHGDDLEAIIAVKKRWGDRLRLHLIASLCPPLARDSDTFTGFQTVILAHHLLFATVSFQYSYLRTLGSANSRIQVSTEGKEVVDRIVKP